MVFSVMVIYLTIAVSYIFFLPCINQLPLSQRIVHQNSIFKRKEQLGANYVKSNFMQRTDKSTLEDKKTVSDFLNAIVEAFVILFFFAQVWKLNLRPFFNRFRIIPDEQYTYLSLCTFRI